jgi:large subunit ribosomal protein L13
MDAVKQIVIDGKGLILGRLASYVAKQALLGKTIVVLNCNEVVVSGARANILGEYARIRGMDGSNLKGPFLPRVPEKLVKRTIRGMLKYKQGRGEQAFDKVRCYNEVPAEFEKANKVSPKELHSHSVKTKVMKLNEIVGLL